MPGSPVDPAACSRGRDARGVAGTPRRPGWTVNGHLVRTADGHPLPGGLHPATSGRQLANGAPANGVSPATESQSDQLSAEFLRSTRDLVAAQRDVVLGYLGVTPARTPAPAPRMPVRAGCHGATTGPRCAKPEPPRPRSRAS